MPEQDQDPRSPESKVRLEQKKLYGDEFPGTTGDGKAWRAWIDARVREQEPVMRDKRLHWARHRHFRQGRQWITSRDGRTWRELDGDENRVRMVLDMIGPALDFRLGIISEQRPGFQTHPLGTGINGMETAEAQQRIAEFYYNKLNGLKLLRDAVAMAQTDGVAFLHVYVDKNAGPTQEDVRLIGPDDARYTMLAAQGYEQDENGMLMLPLSEEGKIAPPGSTVRRIPQGDIAVDIRLAHEVFFDPEAKTVNGPYARAKWCIVRRVRDLKTARLETGNTDLKSETTALLTDPVLDASDVTAAFTTNAGYQRGLPPFPASRFRRDEGVFDYLVYVAPHARAGLGKGWWCRVVGDQLVSKGSELPGSKIPLARITDGSSDNEMFPRPVMATWIPDQLTINAMVSKLVEHIRIFGTGRIATQKGAILTETYSNIVGSLLEYTGAAPQFMAGPSVSRDTWQTLQFFIKKLEDKTGWNDLARGQVTGSGSFADVSGRALLGARELFERQFGPMIRAAAEGMSDWAVLAVDYARWLFETPRLIPIAGRGDLAKRIDADDLGEESVVYMDPETLTPLPRALRNQMLFDLLEKQLITPDEYRKRAPFAEIRDVHMGDVEQWERAQMVNTALEETWQQLAALPPEARYSPEAGGFAILWQDEPNVHKAALLQIALDERKPLDLRDLAMERWGYYDQLERAKTVNPQTGQASAVPPPMTRGIPADMAAQFQMPPPGMPQQQPGGAGQPPGAGAPGTMASPTPEMSPVVTAASQQSAPPLGQFGTSEAAAQQLQEA